MPENDSPLEITPVKEAYFGLDGGAMFGIIPKPLWNKSNPADDNNRIDLACRCLLVQYRDRNVLIDVGIGTKWTDKEANIYKINNQDPGLANHFEQLGLEAEAIDDVVLTHLHFDHAGGVSQYADKGDGRIEATFPNADHWLQRRNWSWANDPSARDEGSYRPKDFRFFEENKGAPKLHLIEGIAEILPGIEVLPFHGHTFGMQGVKIEMEAATIVYLADLIPTTSHLQDPYVMGYDLQPLETVEEKRWILHQASKHDWILAFEHDPETAFARVEFDDNGNPHPVPMSVEQIHQ